MSREGRSYLSLEELQAVNLQMLLEFDALCGHFDIPYSLCGGSALGAVRHKGFIPWDDDVDVMLLRADYERLLALKDVINLRKEGRDLIWCKDRTFARDFARYIHLGYGRDDDQSVPEDCPNHGLDIFPIDFIPDDEASFRKQVRDRKILRHLLLACASPFNTGTSFAKRWLRNAIRPFAKAYGKYRIADKAVAVCRRYDESPQADIAIIAGEYGTRERWSRAGFFPLVRVPFEGKELPIPHGYDEYLSAIYGNYMQLPPVDKRKPPHLHIYKIMD